MNSAHYLSPSELKRKAREELAGNWREVILLHLVPVLISVLLTGGIYGLDLWSISRLANEQGETSVLANFLVSFITIGISFTLLDMIRTEQYKINALKDSFRVFSRPFFIPVFLIQLLQSLFIALWTLVFIIPGIVKGYAYSQAFFIFKDKKELGEEEYPTAIDCITESRELMDGHKMELFSLHITFIGWHIVEALTLGIASLYVRPYLNMAEAVFYDRIAYTEFDRLHQPEAVFTDEIDEDDEGFGEY
ncbi:DUF975 family protein [Alkalibacterium olivapovliticus]|uniref:Putative membrane protein n=1 Tax=Alkalibacterium olivapovliticus TaxID=99907 RepID=A0A2T0VPX9_9LACT|nr:DUF975 family protein [Alkalibacterium olivapovliticus]PRY72489.1 putative membrane protein [Alkalibacterium olivapovliticus]